MCNNEGGCVNKVRVCVTCVQDEGVCTQPEFKNEGVCVEE